MNKQVSESFEVGFLSESLVKQVHECDRYELAPLFLNSFRDHQPVLEAGCGSGRWCQWLGQNGIRCDGVDWSQNLCDRASREIPGSRFIACDMRQVPVPDGSYGGILAIGSIEHSPEGPMPALREFHRLLRPGGLGVITIPYGGRLRILLRQTSNLLLLPLKSSPLVRRLFGKPVGGVSLSEVRRTTNPKWHPRFMHGSEGWFFFEYEFNKAQMREFLAEARLEVRDEFVGFGNEGILHTFRKVAGKWNSERADVDFTLLGRILRALIPVQVMGHILCYVVEKRARF